MEIIYFLAALVLGGFCGGLIVMILWSNTTQKHDEELR